MAGMFYSLEEVIGKLGKTEDQIRELIRAGRLREFRDGPNLLFKIDEVEVLMVETSIRASQQGDAEVQEEAVSEPEPEAMIEPEPESALEPEMDADAILEPELEAELEAFMEPEPEPEAFIEPQVEPEAAAEPQAEPEAAIEPEAAMEPEPEAMIEPEPEAVMESGPEAVMEPEPEPEVVAEPEAAVEPQVEPEPEIGVEPTSDTGAEATVELEAQSGLGAEAEAEAEPAPQADEISLTSESMEELAADTGFGGGDTTSTGEDLGVLGEDTGQDYPSTADDTMSDTRSASSEASLEEIEGDVNLDSFGSGSGLLDLSLQADDTSLGGILDEIYTPEGEQAEGTPGIGAEMDMGASAGDMLAEEALDVPTAGPEMVPMAGVAMYVEPEPDAVSNAMGYMLFLPVLVVIYTAIVAIAGFNDTMPLILEKVQGLIWYIMGGAMLVALLIVGVPVMQGAGGGGGPKKPKAKKVKAPKPKKEKKPKVKKEKKPKKKKEKKPKK